MRINLWYLALIVASFCLGYWNARTSYDEPIVFVDTKEEAIRRAKRDTEISVAGKGYVVFTRTDSMRPYILPEASFVSFDKTPFSELKVHDIITFFSPRNPSEMIIHFVHEKLPNGNIRTKGSNNPAPDPWEVTEMHYIAKVKTIFTAK